MSIKLIIKNGECQVQNATPEIKRLLKEELSYVDKNAEYSYQKNIRSMRYLENIIISGRFGGNSFQEKKLKSLQHANRALQKKLVVELYQNDTFPTGLLPRFKRVMKDIPYEVSDTRKKPKKSLRFVLRESLPPLRYYQKEGTKTLEEHHRGIMVMPTGTGKTVSICKMIWDLGVPTIIITPSKAITDMMMDTVIKYFGKGKVDKLNTKTKKIKKPINVVNIQALIKMDPSVLSGIEAMFIDEFHHSAADTYREINLKHMKNAYYRIGVTATNFRNDGADLALESVLSEVLYEYEIRQAIDDGFLVQPEFEIIDNRTTIHENTYQKEYKSNIVENADRNQLIADIVKDHPHDSVIVLIQQVEHGEALKGLIPEAEFIHGTVKDSERQRTMQNFREGKLKCLIGTTVIGEGVDLPIANVLIMGGGGKARSQIMQNVGRVLRIFDGKDCALVYDFMDRGSRWISEHSLLRQQIYEQY